MKALSINHPWAWLIVNGFKTVENRDWDTRYRGDFLIHAGKKIDFSCYEFLEDTNIDAPSPDQLQTGGIVGKATLINTVHIKDRHLITQKDQIWFFGDYGFILDNAEPIPFRPCKGALGFFTPDYNSRYVEKKPKPQKQQAQGSLI